MPQSVRCQSPTCDAPGGRTLYVSDGDTHTVTRRGSGVVVSGVVLGVVCRCGWTWRNPDAPHHADRDESAA